MGCLHKRSLDKRGSTVQEIDSDIFQHILSEQIRDIPGAINISDDILRLEQEHDQALHTILQQSSNSGLTISPEKCELHNLPSLG